MARALDLAWRGWGRVQPNPLVGAVVLAGGQPVAEGWHAEYGETHAEALALAYAGDRARDSTLVVTLEPCTHQGKQPPCVDAILRAGVARVVAALPDPNPLASGGAARLRAAGVDVTMGVLADAAVAQNAVFLHRLRNSTRPFVALKLATSLDGRIADASGRSRWISSAEAGDYVHWLRAGFDAIAVGGRTARADDPALTVRGTVQPRVTPRRIVFTATADLPAAASLIRTAREIPTLVLAAPGAPAGNVRRLEAEGVTVLIPESLERGLLSLRQMGINSLLVEGGGRLAGALLAADLVDRYYLVQSPIWLGEGLRAIEGLPGVPLEHANPWRVVERRALGQDTLLVLDRDPCLPES
ncbi:MAG TPA: bifunctional diaminohydroxyphosphoribosylaminopyrimidine deaminase/5-amino-6-(5-phosphoribosylamino)uracil reductase RibD [Gemmatimonadales bacterium]|jgi:diaminohydroxyphosphoribosylaminopyrimidine deaminase/5-amino-6-(5-phosphoribosylamino)uracil reductase